MLELDPGAMNVSRMRGSEIPFIVEHDKDDVVGRVDGLKADGGNVVAAAHRISSSRADEIWPRIESGELKGISAGYDVYGVTLAHVGDSPDQDRFRATDWVPTEASICGVRMEAKDSGARVKLSGGRGMIEEAYIKYAIEQGMDESEARNFAVGRRTGQIMSLIDARRGKPKEDQVDPITKEQFDAVVADVAAIREKATADEAKAEELGKELSATRAALDESQKGAAEANAQIEAFKKRQDEQEERIRSINIHPDGGNRGRAQAQALERPFEVGRLLLALASGDPGDYKDASLEMEVTERQRAVNGAHGGLVMDNQLMNRAVRSIKDSEVAYVRDLMENEEQPDVMIGTRAVATVGGLEDKVVDWGLSAQWLFDYAPLFAKVTMVQGDPGEQLEIPKATAKVTAYAVAEGTEPTESAASTGTLNMQPHDFELEQPLSRRALRRPGQMAFYMQQVAMELSDHMLYSTLLGTGTGAEVTGLNASGVNNTAKNLSALAYDDMPDFKAAVRKHNIPEGDRAVIMSPDIAAKYEKTNWNTTGSDRKVKDPEMPYMTESSHLYNTAANTDLAFYGYWPELIVAMWGGIEVWVDSLTKAGSVRILSFTEWDARVRRIEAFQKFTVTTNA